MEKEHRNDDPMDFDQPEDAPPPSSPLGSPSYSPPELTDRTEKEEEVRSDDDDDEQEDEDDEEERAARRKAKGKGKASSQPEDEEEEDDDDDDDEEERAARRKAKGKGKASPQPEDDDDEHLDQIDMDMDTYWAIQAHEALEVARLQEALDSGREMQFGDADAAMNDAISSPSPSNEGDNENTSPAAPKNSPERRQAGWLDSPKLIGKLRELQQEQDDGRGRGRGRGKGWAWAWQENMTQERVEKEGWGAYDNPAPSPAQEEEERWEVYDPKAWENATEQAAEQEAHKVTLKVPHSSFSVKATHTEEEKRFRDSVVEEKVGEENLANQSVDLVIAVRDYKAILAGSFLSYEKDDVMMVNYRDSDGKLFTLLPFKDGAVPGRAHTKNFVPADPAARDASSDEVSRGRAESKGG